MEFDFKILLTLAISAVAPPTRNSNSVGRILKHWKSQFILALKNRNVVIIFNLKFHLVFISEHRNRPWIFFMLSVWSVLFLSVAGLSLLYLSLFLIWGKKITATLNSEKIFHCSKWPAHEYKFTFPLVSMNWGPPCARHCGSPQVDIKKIRKAKPLFSRSLHQSGEGGSEIYK